MRGNLRKQKRLRGVMFRLKERGIEKLSLSDLKVLKRLKNEKESQS